MKKIILWLLVFSTLLLLMGCGEYHYGRVVDESEQGLEDVQVEIGGQEVETNEKGYFPVKNIEGEEVTLILQKEGYQTREIQVNIEEGNELGEHQMEKE
ncbi:MAG: carboxypeptidase-like regulatory domain-containing protein [Bacillota bacterium]